MLSDYFETSLDELVKRDLSLMKQKQSLQALNWWSILAFGGILVGVQIIGSYEISPLSLIPVGLVLSFALFAADRIEVIKKQEDVQTYREIKAYMDNQPLSDEEKREAESKKEKSKVPSILLKLFSGAAFALLISLVVGTLLKR